MIRLSGTEDIYISEDLLGYVDKLREEGTITRRVDLLLMGFSYAVTHELAPAENFPRHSLIKVYGIDDMKLVIEATAQWYAERIRYSLESSSDLLNLICGLGVAGARELRDQWREKSKPQIWWDIMELSN